jgi:hypothetical protein
MTRANGQRDLAAMVATELEAAAAAAGALSQRLARAAGMARALEKWGALGAPTPVGQLATRVERILNEAGPEGLDRTRLNRALGSHVRREHLEAAIGLLEEAGRVETDRIRTDGRPRTVTRLTAPPLLTE